jgi:hypothetical protein
MFLVKAFTILFSLKNSLKITFRTVYIGTAKSMPIGPANRPAKMIIRNISRGCDLTLFEKI